MSAKTGIQWTDATWNPMMGCRRVSAGCEHCYAEQIAARFSAPGQAFHGIARRRSNGEAQWTGHSALNLRTLRLPLSWRRPRRIFVNSMSDVFYEQFSDEQIDRVFAVMALAPRHTFQVLTKRPERMREYLSCQYRWAQVEAACNDLVGSHEAPALATPDRRFLPNVWLGVSVENQEAANERIPLLGETPAAVRFLSCEPLLDGIDITHWLDDSAIDWVIIGGESGPHARPCNINWIADLVAQCEFSGARAFVKQLGRRPIDVFEDKRNEDLKLRDSHGGDWSEWPAKLRVRQFPDLAPVAA